MTRNNGRIINCQQCGKEIYIRPSEEGRKKFCSHKCHNEARFMPRGTCKICGTVVSKVGAKYCTHKCQGVSATKPRPKCLICGKILPKEKHRRAKYCSPECGRVSRRNRYESKKKPLPDCVICGKEVNTRSAQTCSHKCGGIYRRHKRNTCPICGTKVENLENRYCSPKCAGERGGKRWKDKSGYIYFYDPTSPLATCKGGVAEHRQIFWEASGKCADLLTLLNNGSHIHHINGKRDDNRINNLELRVDGNHPSGVGESDMVKVLNQLGYKIQEPLWKTA